MSVSRKDIESIAASIAEADMSTWPFPLAVGAAATRRPLSDNETERLRSKVALMMADTLVSLSDGFDPIRFVRDCGIRHQSLSEQAIRNSSKRIDIRARSLAAGRS